MGTRCLSISVVRRAGGAAGSVRRRAGASGVADGGRRVSSLIGVLGCLQRTGDAAVLPDPPEMDGQEEGGSQRHEDDVRDVEAQKRVLTDLQAAEDEQLRHRVEDRRALREVYTDGDCPEGDLVPR